MGLLSRGLGWLEKSKVHHRMFRVPGYSSCASIQKDQPLFSAEGPTFLCNLSKRKNKHLEQYIHQAFLKL
jgi:hypothetical protein